ncbi:MAG TPA: sigma-70 family RNA polymerase sigma factor [Acidimicrobiales bacterium]|jgi:RNA polymerase sigma-70 factor (ECF subfamily)|nr:sigma-70 family RNA polymerase sigma factor [Acidimicrobiales bacterium]
MPMLDADAEWVNAAYAAHGRELYRFALRSLGDTGLAEDAVQTTYLQAWRNAARFDDDLGSLRTWLFAIARNVVIDLARARSVRPPLAREDLAADAIIANGVPDADIDQLVASWQVEEALRRLSEDHRTVLIETYYRGRPYDAVAGDLGIPIGTVKSRVYYALKALRLALDELGWADDG